MNGFQKILKQMYNKIKDNYPLKRMVPLKNEENLEVNCDLIGEILLKCDCIPYVRYIEEILEVKDIYINI
jgi:hypothetical protein